MPKVVSKGLITGRPAFSNGGLGLSIGSGVGGIRNAIASRAPDGIKIGNSSGNNSGFSFVVNELSINGGIFYVGITDVAIQFLDFSQFASFGQPYSVFQNKKSVVMNTIIDFIEFFLPVSQHATNVTSNSFEITFPIISGIEGLQLEDLTEFGDLFYQRSGSSGPLVLNNGIINDFLTSSQFTVRFGDLGSLSLNQIKEGLRFYSGKTFKYQLNSNDSGVVTYNNVSIPFVKKTRLQPQNKSLLPPSLSRSAFFPGHRNLSRFNKGKKNQQVNGGIRNAIARNSIKIGNSDDLSLSVASRVNLSFDTQGANLGYFITGRQIFSFAKGLGQFGKKHPVFQNRKSILIYCVLNTNVAFCLCVSRHATNVTPNSFEITFPIISDIDALKSTNISDNKIKYQRSGPSGPLVLNNSLTQEQLTTSSKFTVEFGAIGTLTLNAWKRALRFYSGKTIKYKLNTNNNGVIKYNNVTIPFGKLTPVG